MRSMLYLAIDPTHTTSNWRLDMGDTESAAPANGLCINESICRPYQDDGGDMTDAVGAGPCERFVASNFKRSTVELRREVWKLFQLLAIAIDEKAIDTGPEETAVLGYLVNYVGQGNQFAGRQLLTEDAQADIRIIEIVVTDLETNLSHAVQKTLSVHTKGSGQ